MSRDRIPVMFPAVDYAGLHFQEITIERMQFYLRYCALQQCIVVFALYLEKAGVAFDRDKFAAEFSDASEHPLKHLSHFLEWLSLRGHALGAEMRARLQNQIQPAVEIGQYERDEDNRFSGLCYGFALIASWMKHVGRSAYWREILDRIDAWEPENVAELDEVIHLDVDDSETTLRHCIELACHAVIFHFPYFEKGFLPLVGEDQYNQSDLLGSGWFDWSSRDGDKHIQVAKHYNQQFDAAGLAAFLEANHMLFHDCISLVGDMSHVCSIYYDDVFSAWYFYDANDDSGDWRACDRAEAVAQAVLSEAELSQDLVFQFASEENKPIELRSTRPEGDPSRYADYSLAHVAAYDHHQLSRYLIGVERKPDLVESFTHSMSLRHHDKSLFCRLIADGGIAYQKLFSCMLLVDVDDLAERVRLLFAREMAAILTDAAGDYIDDDRLSVVNMLGLQIKPECTVLSQLLRSDAASLALFDVAFAHDDSAVLLRRYMVFALMADDHGKGLRQLLMRTEPMVQLVRSLSSGEATMRRYFSEAVAALVNPLALSDWLTGALSWQPLLLMAQWPEATALREQMRSVLDLPIPCRKPAAFLPDIFHGHGRACSSLADVLRERLTGEYRDSLDKLLEATSAGDSATRVPAAR